MGCGNSRHKNDEVLPKGTVPQMPTSNAPNQNIMELTTRAPQDPQPTTAPGDRPDQPLSPEGTLDRASNGSLSQPVATQPASPIRAKAKSKTITSTRTANSEALVPTTTALLEKLPRFRILVIGKTGVGKTTLINKTFDVLDTGRTSVLARGQSNINEELTSRSNDRFVLHDSMGFEPGEKDHFAAVKAFVDQRRTQPLLKDKLHAIWLCVSTPSTGGRIFETGDEDFLKLKLDGDGFTIPVIIVFTKYDVLVSEVERSMENDDDDAVNAAAKEKFHAVCAHRLEEIMKGVDPPHPHITVSIRYQETLKELVQTTQVEIGKQQRLASEAKKPLPEPSRTSSGHLAKHLPPVEAVKLAWAMAQRVNPDLKVKASIAVGKQKYWRGIEGVPGFDLEVHIDAIHADIIKVWNFNDPDSLLTQEDFRKKIFEGIKDLNEDANILATTHGLMGYIVDLTIIMHQNARIGTVTQKSLHDASNKYYQDLGKEVHQKIKQYIPIHPAKKDADPTLEEVTKLINEYCSIPGDASVE